MPIAEVTPQTTARPRQTQAEAPLRNGTRKRQGLCQPAANRTSNPADRRRRQAGCLLAPKSPAGRPAGRHPRTSPAPLLRKAAGDVTATRGRAPPARGLGMGGAGSGWPRCMTRARFNAWAGGQQQSTDASARASRQFRNTVVLFESRNARKQNLQRGEGTKL